MTSGENALYGYICVTRPFQNAFDDIQGLETDVSVLLTMRPTLTKDNKL